MGDTESPAAGKMPSFLLQSLVGVRGIWSGLWWQRTYVRVWRRRAGLLARGKMDEEKDEELYKQVLSMRVCDCHVLVSSLSTVNKISVQAERRKAPGICWPTTLAHQLIAVGPDSPAAHTPWQPALLLTAGRWTRRRLQRLQRLQRSCRDAAAISKGGLCAHDAASQMTTMTAPLTEAAPAAAAAAGAGAGAGAAAAGVTAAPGAAAAAAAAATSAAPNLP